MIDMVCVVGFEVEVFDMMIFGNVGGMFYGYDVFGIVCFFVDCECCIFVGCMIIGFEVVDFLHVVTIVIVGEVLLEWFCYVVLVFFMCSEIWLKFLERVGL